ncbi:hypothetical protein [Antribacter gilvus]|uniref:hypothetical protein n=1 Tax=Antribacter gilvus TaxID=2304675 RepID=UPI000F7AD880|nr:hypothetical protein [Antribacter gilvus]
MTATDVIGSSPISFTDAQGSQRFVPLSALQIDGSALAVKSGWAAQLEPSEIATLLEVATARLAGGEISSPPVPAPQPALLVSAKHAGPEGNGITATVTVSDDPPLEADLHLAVVQTNTYAGLATAKAAAQAIGVEKDPVAPGDPPRGTGLVVVKSSSVDASAALPKAGTQKKAKLDDTGLKVVDKDDKALFTLVPAADYTGADGLTAQVTVEDDTFTVEITYDSSKEASADAPFSLADLTLPPRAAYVVGVSAPPSGAGLPKPGSVTLTGGAPGLTADGLLYTA